MRRFHFGSGRSDEYFEGGCGELDGDDLDGCLARFSLPWERGRLPFMFSKTNLGGEESEQSLPSWISDHHLGAKSYIDETSQSPSFPPISPNSPEMDTSSLTKESNVMSQAELDKLGSTYSFPSGVRLRIPGDGETILSARQGACTPLASYPIRGGITSKARPEKNLFRGSPSNYGRLTCDFPGKSCNKLPTLSEVDAERTEAIFGKIEPGGYFEVSKVLGSRTFRKHFAAGCAVLSTSGGDNTTSGDEGEFVSCEDSVEYLGVIRRGIGGAIRRALPGIPDETLLRWLEGKVKDPFTNLLFGESVSRSDSRSDSLSDSELPPELRSDAMSARVGASALGERTGGKAKAREGDEGDDSQASHQRSRYSGETHTGRRPVIKIGEPDSFEGKRSRATPAPPKRFKSNRGAINARGRAAEAGTSFPGGEVGSESMSDASMARRLLTGVIPASDKKEVNQLSRMNWSPNLSMPWVSQEHLHDINGPSRRRIGWPSLTRKDQGPGTEVDDLKATVAELTDKLAKAKELAIEDFKASEEFKAAVTDSAATYFGDGFEFCKRQLLHQFLNLGADVANMAMDPSFAEEVEATKEGGDHVARVAP
ncbi:hypothetical protein Acr_12g0011180 [Actinidia rufa]|uniref:Uncharacterized protein n=1 Tax=Actinidia rufa TaxID=165716 RepID=A0A7J0FKX4_9ERIC|nr:hypothetical protein Acr_12g0011180 [Actinidia rufa]